MDTVGHVSHRHLYFGPSGKEDLEEAAADAAVEAADSVGCATAAQREIRHIERLGVVAWIHAAQRHQIAERNLQFFLGIHPEVPVHEVRGKAVKSGSHGRMGGEQIARAGRRQRDVERLAVILHERTRALQHGERGVTFVEMTDFGP